MPDRIDAWTHIFPKTYFEKLQTMASATGPLKRWLKLTSLYDLDHRFRLMDGFEGYRQLLTPSMLAVTCFANAGTPSMNWVITNDRIPPTMPMPPSNTNATATPRGRERRSRKSTAGSNNAVSIVANATGTTMSSTFVTTHSSATIAANITSSRDAHAAVLRTNGVTDSSATESTEGPAGMPVA